MKPKPRSKIPRKPMGKATASVNQPRAARFSASVRLWAMPLIALLILSGCAAQNASTSTPPSPPTPPQVQIASDVNTLAQSLNAALTTLRAARDQGKLSAADVATAEKVAGIIASTGKSIDAELRTTDDWPTMKSKLLAIVKSAALQNALKSLPPTAAAALATAAAAYNAIASTVGGPTI